MDDSLGTSIKSDAIRPRRTRFVLHGMVFCSFLAAATAAQPQTPLRTGTVSSEEVLGSSHFSPVVRDLDKAIEFYGGLLGLSVPPPREPGPRPWDTQQNLRNLQGLPDVPIRYVVAAIPGERWGVELIEFQDADRKPVRSRVQDPGATTLVLIVRNVDMAFAPLKQAAVPVVTLGGLPITVDGGKARAVVVKDPDGHFVELRQPTVVSETSAAASNNILGARVRVTVQDTERTMHLYRDLFGLQFEVGPFVQEKTLDALLGTKDAKIRFSTLESPMRLEFVEFQGVDRAPLKTRISDPGSTKYPIRVRDLDSAIEKLKSTGGTVVSLNGEATVVRNVRYAIVHELNNLFLIVTQVPESRSGSNR